MNEEDILKSLDVRYGRCEKCKKWINKDIYLEIQMDQDVYPVTIFIGICFRCGYSLILDYSYREKSRLFILANLYDYEISKNDNN